MSNFEYFELFLRYGFDINGTVTDKNNLVLNFLTFQTNRKQFLSNASKIKFLITHDIDINFIPYKICKTNELDDNLNLSFIDYLIIDFLVMSDNPKYSYHLIRFTINYYCIINNKELINMIVYGKERLFQKKVLIIYLKKNLNT